MDNSETQSDVMAFVKAMTDINRLRMVGALATDSATSLELAESLGLQPNEILRHLEILAEVGLIDRDESTERPRFRFDQGELEQLARKALQRKLVVELIAADKVPEATADIVKRYANPDGSLRALPLNQRRFDLICEYVSHAIAPGQDYTEREIDAALEIYHPDTTALRRGLIDIGYLGRWRDGSKYWVIADE
jgi:predicted transcriptional regulator